MIFEREFTALGIMSKRQSWAEVSPLPSFIKRNLIINFNKTFNHSTSKAEIQTKIDNKILRLAKESINPTSDFMESWIKFVQQNDDLRFRSLKYTQAISLNCLKTEL